MEDQIRYADVGGQGFERQAGVFGTREIGGDAGGLFVILDSRAGFAYSAGRMIHEAETGFGHALGDCLLQVSPDEARRAGDEDNPCVHDREC